MTVIECASIVLGPLTAQYLGDLGADVLKVEPATGDLTRHIGPRRSPTMGSLFLTNNRNKRSVVLDLKNPAGRATLDRLVDRADVFLHSVRGAAAARLGLDHATLAARNPRLVYCHVKGFADDGPYGGKPAYDDVVQSLSGLAMLQTVVTGEPRYMPSILADKVTAVHAAYAVTAALLHRERTGLGQKVDVPMLETMAGFNTVEHLWGATFEPPLGPMGYEPVSTASRRPFATRDGYLSFLPYSDVQWKRFFSLIGRDDVMEDPRFATFAARQQNVALVWGEIGHQLTMRTNAEWTDLLGHEDIPFAVVNSLDQLTEDPHLVGTGFWQLHEDPVEGTLRLPTSSLGLSESPAGVHRLPPRLGEHTREILTEIGLDDAAIARLAAEGGTDLDPA
ncbi:crotonobetainyl-CoA:carnitine CoA-transferase CaiB-like acyl-CoA transferase [Pseudonocardia sediminis]|uniref:Crotonobetainyl-CoA:carnitine CoA-transferase CaiB-like acyl-CoA transferase n=1 Tax=Pseudonocardia sediminis TaxID=1397368 RepID=A0A4Q7V1D4_PSEST|nr:CoA transferase [Pseudonocardia sediminis]RZT87131.1 crotonobetainyl-CoA:carnitine CoA-transferase CaiB-like acyl-CoA transferase [Pseudonocardia sediminis]